MTSQDRQAFGVSFAILAEVFGDQLSPVKIEAYFDALVDFPIEEVQAAIRRAIKTCRFFPRPVEIIEEIRAVRRALIGELKSLPEPPEPTVQERKEIEQSIQQFRQLVGDAVAVEFLRQTPRRPHLRLVTQDEAEAHEAKKADALRKLRRAMDEAAGA